MYCAAGKVQQRNIDAMVGGIVEFWNESVKASKEAPFPMDTSKDIYNTTINTPRPSN